MFKANAARFASRMRVFGTDRAGSILPIFAIMAVVVVVVAGAGIDYGRAINNREVMTHALDSAALAVARKLSTSIMTDAEIDELAKQVFEANLSSLDLKDLAVTNLDAVADADAGTVTVTSTIAVPTYFVHIGGIGPENIDVNVGTVVNYSKFDVELALILDVTGSMSEDPADIEALKTAAKDLVDTLIPDGTQHQDSKVRISIVPYSQGVNLGEYATRVSDGKTGSRHCVTERNGDRKYTDAIYNYDGKNSNFFGGVSEYEVQEYSPPRTTNWVSEACPSVPILPLTAKRVQLLKSIKSLTGDAGTAGQTGISWGWYTLSPKWSSLWPPEGTPASYDDDDTLKFAVIMTDGGFNMSYDTATQRECGWKGYRWVCGDVEHWYQTWYPYAGYNDEPAARGRKFCQKMKKKGIEVYSIFFETSDSNFGKDLMGYCASSKSNFYYADSQADLVQAFGNIAKKIQSIYLSK